MNPKASIRIAIAEDQRLMRVAMIELLEMEPDFQVVFEAENGERLLQFLAHGQVDLVLTDLEMPKVGGMEVLRHLQKDRPALPVMVLSSHEEEETILQAIEFGAKGYLRKNSRPEEVKHAVRSVIRTGHYFKDSISQLLGRGEANRSSVSVSPQKKKALSKREREVLALICEELTNEEIAQEMSLSKRTVESYRKNMIAKVGARNTVGLVLYAVKEGLIDVK